MKALEIAILCSSGYLLAAVAVADADFESVAVVVSDFVAVAVAVDVAVAVAVSACAGRHLRQTPPLPFLGASFLCESAK